MIIKETGCRVSIGQNGKILVTGQNRDRELMVEKVINLIEEQAHISGLTNRTQEYLKKMKEELR
jgi:exosome complex component RRP4